MLYKWNKPCCATDKRICLGNTDWKWLVWCILLAICNQQSEPLLKRENIFQQCFFKLKTDYALGNTVQNPINCRLMEFMKWPLKDQGVCNFYIAKPSWELMLIITNSHNNHKKSWTSVIQRVMGSIALWDVYLAAKHASNAVSVLYKNKEYNHTSRVFGLLCACSGALYQLCNLKIRNIYN